MLGDLNVAEPNALIGFAGPRVIEQTIREKLPKGFQRSEFLLKHGMVDDVVPRKALRKPTSSAPCGSSSTARNDERPFARGLPGTALPRLPAYLRDLQRFGIKLGLDSMRTVLASFGDPAAGRSRPSTWPGRTARARFARCWPRSSGAVGLKVGWYTSPHLVRVEERIRVGGGDEFRIEGFLPADADGQIQDRASARST